MQRSRWLGYVAAGLFGVAAAGCGTLTPIEYAPRPETVKAPEKELEETMNMTADPPVKVEVTETYVKGVWAGWGVVTEVVRYSSIAGMKLVHSEGATDKYGPGYVVEVRDGSGDPTPFRFKDQASAQRMMDILAALHERAAAKH